MYVGKLLASDSNVPESWIMQSVSTHKYVDKTPSDELQQWCLEKFSKDVRMVCFVASHPNYFAEVSAALNHPNND